MSTYCGMSIKEIKERLLELYSEQEVKEILSLPVDEVISILEEEDARIIKEVSSECFKHSESRKKKANRTKKKTTTYKKSKDKKWIEKRRSNIPNEETTSRSYLNKASKRYNKLHPRVKPKAKKANKNS